MAGLTPTQRQALENLPDDWALTPACFEPNTVLVGLVAEKLAKTKRERPAPAAPYRYYVRRTALGRQRLGLPSMPEGTEDA